MSSSDRIDGSPSVTIEASASASVAASASATRAKDPFGVDPLIDPILTIARARFSFARG